MSIQQEKYDKFKKLLEISTSGLTKEEFLKHFKLILEKLVRLEEQLILRLDGKTDSTLKELNKLHDQFSGIIAEAKKDSDSTFSGIKRRMTEAISAMF